MAPRLNELQFCKASARASDDSALGQFLPIIAYVLLSFILAANARNSVHHLLLSELNIDVLLGVIMLGSLIPVGLVSAATPCTLLPVVDEEPDTPKTAPPESSAIT